MNRATVPGQAPLILADLREGAVFARRALARTRAEADLADLRTVARLCGLPRPVFHSSRFGIVGTFTGPDGTVEDAVREWAEAFAVKPWIQAPGPLLVRGHSVECPGCAVMHAEVRGLPFTVGGRLVETQAVTS